MNAFPCRVKLVIETNNESAPVNEEFSHMGMQAGDPERRILSVWFPRLAVERVERRERIDIDTAVAVISNVGNAQIIISLTAAAEAAGVRIGQSLRDACAIYPNLITRSANLPADADFLSCLCRFADKYSPMVAKDSDSGLIIDVTGCAHLFGGEENLLIRMESDLADLGLTTRSGIADTVGAAWAITRFAGHSAAARRSGDDIDQEARATRSRAARRRLWQRHHPTANPEFQPHASERIIPPGETRAFIACLPVAALRLPEKTIAETARIGLRKIGDIMDMPRAALARRYGEEILRRLDQALGFEPEPVSPEARPPRYICRMSFPDPIGLDADVLAGIDRLLPPLCSRLEKNGHATRRIQLIAHRVDSHRQVLEVGLAQATNSVDRIRPLLKIKLDEVRPGFGIDALQLEALAVEPADQTPCNANLGTKRRTNLDESPEFRDLIGKIGARIGLEAITRHHPADSHIPEKTYSVMAAAWSKPVSKWQQPDNLRPAILFEPELVYGSNRRTPPKQFRWRQRTFVRKSVTGPERIIPEWWLDDPNWRSGTRDYWRVETECGARLWLFYAYGGPFCSEGWFCHGNFG